MCFAKRIGLYLKSQIVDPRLLIFDFGLLMRPLQHSAFSIQHSAFSIQHSAFSNQQSKIARLTCDL